MVRYYLTFDKNNILYTFIETKVKAGGIIILDKVYEECKFTAKGIVIQSLSYLSKKNIRAKTDELLPSQKLFNQLKNKFINGPIKNRLSSVEFENRKNSFLNSADAKLILYSLQNKNNVLTSHYS